MALTEMQQKSNFSTGSLQIVEQLALVRFTDGLSGLHFDNNLSSHQQVDSVFPDRFTAIENLNEHFKLGIDSAMLKLDQKRILVHGLEKAKAEIPVYSEEPSKQLFAEMLFEHGFLSVVGDFSKTKGWLGHTRAARDPFSAQDINPARQNKENGTYHGSHERYEKHTT